MRQPLPHRRVNTTIAATWDGHDFSVTVGFDALAQPREVFADTAKGGDMQAVLADACVVISIALQHRIPFGDLAKSLGRVPVVWAEGDAPASPIGAIVEAIAEAAAWVKTGCAA